jgi:long-chain acyl-CoA synthetase
MISASTLPAMLEASVARFPSHVALDFMGRRITYQQLGGFVDAMAARLQAEGICKGDRVGLFLPNCPAFVIAYFAVLKIGGVVVPCSPLYSASELAHQMKDADVRAMVLLDVAELVATLRQAVAEHPVERVLVSRLAAWLPLAKSLAYRVLKRDRIAKLSTGDRILEEWIASSALPPRNDVPLTPDDLAVLQYTGGTTGRPKGAMLTHGNLTANLQQCRAWGSTLEDGKEVVLAVLPFFHIFAMTTVMNLGLSIGARILLHPRFVLKDALRAIARDRPTLLPGVPTMFAAFLNACPPENPLPVGEGRVRGAFSSLKACISGGAPLPLEIKKRFESLSGCRLVEGYGLTECAPVVAACPLVGDAPEGAAGQLLVGTECRIDPLPDAEDRKVGEICIRGPQVMRGYWQHPHETSEVLDAEGWLRTGDVGYVDADGFLFIVDRCKDMIICGGFNVYPRDVEEALYRHPAVLEAAVIGKPDAYLGQAVHAVLVVRADSTLTPEEVIAHCRLSLAKYKIPKSVEFRDSLPKTMIGKVLRRAL